MNDLVLIVSGALKVNIAYGMARYFHYCGRHVFIWNFCTLATGCEDGKFKIRSVQYVVFDYFLMYA